MFLRFYLDRESGLPHIFSHGVEENEVEDVLASPSEDRPGREGSRVAVGRTSGGRYLRVIYRARPRAQPGLRHHGIRGERKTARRLSSAHEKERNMKNTTNFPPGWDEERVQRVLQHYDSLTEEEAVAEDEAAFEDSTQTVMEIPKELVPAVRALLADRAT